MRPAFRHDSIMIDLSHDQRVALSRQIVALLDAWGANAEDSIALLALPPDTKPRQLRRYYENTPLPDEAAIWERVEHLLGIAEALRTSYPHNANGGRLWLNQPHRLFDQRTPLAAMLEDGLRGIFAVRAYLDCAWDWNRSGSKPSPA
jgi:hypothetical protein